MNLLLPINEDYNFLDSSIIGKNTLDADVSFAKIASYTKNLTKNVFQSPQFVYNLFSKSVLNDFDSSVSFNFKYIKNYNLMSVKSFLLNYETLFDLNTLNRLFKSDLGGQVFNTFLNDMPKNTYSRVVSNGYKYSLFSNIGDLISSKFNPSSLKLLLKKSNPLLSKIRSLDINFGSDYFMSKTTNKSFNFLPLKSFNKVSKLNSFQKSNYQLNSGVTKKNLLSYHFSKNISPFFLDINNSKLDKYTGPNSSKTLLPVLFNSSSLHRFKDDLFNLKLLDSGSATINDSFNHYKSSLWGSRYIKKDFSILNKNPQNLNSFNLFNTISSFFYYPDYDFLNKDDIKLLDSLL